MNLACYCAHFGEKSSQDLRPTFADMDPIQNGKRKGNAMGPEWCEIALVSWLGHCPFLYG